jgi:trimeric autotransporter adhesin
MKLSICCLLVALLVLSLPAAAQMANSKAAASSPSADVPKLVKFSGTAIDESGKPVSGVVGVTFSLYKDQLGGAPLWVETQNVQADANGHYTAMLGANTSDGVSLEIFSSAEAHWVGTQISGQREQPRVLLLSVPYALKAADAETLGGLPASAFVHAAPNAAGSVAGAKASPSAPSTAPAAGVTGKGTKNFIPIWTGATTLGNSVIYETGGQVGVGTKAPGAEVDSVGTGVAVRGTSSGATGTGVLGSASSSSGTNFGVFGQTASSSNGATGVFGNSAATSGIVFGMQGITASASGVGVQGVNNGSNGGNAVDGFANATSGNANGVYGQSASTGGDGVLGVATATSGLPTGFMDRLRARAATVYSDRTPRLVATPPG